MEYSPDQLDILLKAAPQHLFHGLSTISGDQDCFNLALAALDHEQRTLHVAVMHHGGKLKAAQALAPGDLTRMAACAANITSALRQLRKEFDRVSETYIPKN